jgi:hypothetical protein
VKSYTLVLMSSALLLLLLLLLPDVLIKPLPLALMLWSLCCDALCELWLMWALLLGLMREDAARGMWLQECLYDDAGVLPGGIQP